MSKGNKILYKSTMCFSDCAAMSMLPLLLLLFLLHFLLHGANAKCAIGDADDNAKWINSDGRLKNHDNGISPDTDSDDYFLFQASCSEDLDYDDLDEFCNCTFTNSKLQIA
jgi:hypothetical protein